MNEKNQCIAPDVGTQALIKIVEDGKAISRILADIKDSIDFQAAELLQDFAERITGTKPEILPVNSEMKNGDVLIGNFQLPVKGINAEDIKEDGFILMTIDGYIRIVHGTGKGSIYGVVTLLEDYFGIHYFTENTYTIHKNKNMYVPANINRIENPSFRYRQINSYSQKDPIYKLWHRLKSPDEVFVEKMWVHTFNRILPASEFGESHPEYYAFINGERRPGTASQWCLTNPEVFEIVASRVNELFKANPDKHIISISQNDSQNHCCCEKCKAIDEHEGGPSGSIIYFLNKLAERFPDKEFSTLAYLYSVSPPRHIKPLPNVNIMLCSIDCHREAPLTENSKSFVRDVEGWAAISNNIFVWDYGINFDNYISPFPNFHILQPNIELFFNNNATMHFSQINSVKGGDFAELRAYLVAKLMWNTSADLDFHMKTFLKEYYGEAAAPYLHQYIKLREKALIESKTRLWIYDTPITHKDGMLNDVMIESYKKMFDEAEQASDQSFLDHIHEARLPIMYAELEISRTKSDRDIEKLTELLNLFRDRAKKLNVIELNEKRNTIEEYYDLYVQRYLSETRKSLARECPVEYISPPNSPYDKIADKALTDGLYGGATFNESWVGWCGKNAEFIIDLGEIKKIQEVEADFLNHLGAWVLLPKSMSCSISTDNVQFKLMGQTEIDEDRELKIKFVPVSVSAGVTIEARYIKLKIETIGLCPAWHYGVGFPAWFFLDEVNVY